ncbi:MAG: hypothetical protein M1831_000924 [Alyxoria varia]|nr:MAG: hypothetical protein M1831_000924 [Alyxoria varia]
MNDPGVPNPSPPSSQSSQKPSTPSFKSAAGTLPDQNATAKSDNEAEKAKAANTIQRNYRGYRTRRELQGQSLSASARLYETIKEARYQDLTRPCARAELQEGSKSSVSRSAFAQEEWKRVRGIAQRAGMMEPSDSDSTNSGMSDEELWEYRRRKAEAKAKRERHAKMMGLEYFLEMIDQKHRYGSHLRAYHGEWKKADTNENFFYWLDYGEGKNIEVPWCTRESLDRDQVRYLTREERQKYLVKFDKDGRMCWAKNGERVTTSLAYRDSIEGIVPQDSPIPGFHEETFGRTHSQQRPGSSTSSMTSIGSESAVSDEESRHYVNHELSNAKGLQKVQHITAGAMLNRLLQSTTKKNTWIFVADTSFRLYIGIKQSGSFQHSSFLQGSRISAAGLIKAKDGQLRSLSPLSGHYRPPTKNFRAFVHSLRDEAGADMSRVSISKSYAVLLGLEGYMKSKQKIKRAEENVEQWAEGLVKPEEVKKKKALESMEGSRSTRLMRDAERREEERRRKEGWRGWLGKRFSVVKRPEDNSGAGDLSNKIDRLTTDSKDETTITRDTAPRKSVGAGSGWSGNSAGSNNTTATPLSPAKSAPAPAANPSSDINRRSITDDSVASKLTATTQNSAYKSTSRSAFPAHANAGKASPTTQVDSTSANVAKPKAKSTPNVPIQGQDTMGKERKTSEYRSPWE